MTDLLGIPLPEMVFPHNSLTLHHEATNATYSFDALSALYSVHGVPDSQSKGKGKALNPRATQPGMLKVSHAKEWGKSRSAASALPFSVVFILTLHPSSQSSRDNSCTSVISKLRLDIFMHLARLVSKTEARRVRIRVDG